MIEGCRAAIMAIVHSADGVRCVVTGPSSEVVTSCVAEYVRERCDDVLWPEAARRVRAMLDCRDLNGAISLYFDRVGERWDDERLELITVADGRTRANFNEETVAGA